jgi:hypothetical protein
MIIRSGTLLETPPASPALTNGETRDGGRNFNRKDGVKKNVEKIRGQKFAVSRGRKKER